ncbi:MAG: DUF4399 domain-containing protein [Nitriliruptoraceae bacterium]
MLVAPLRTVRTAPGRDRVPVVTAGAAALGLLVAVARGPGAVSPPAARILHPPDGAVLGSPVPVVLAADGVVLVPCGPAAACEGHLNVLVDRPCLPAGELVPSGSLRADDLGVHALTDGSRVLLLDLAPGEHTLCAQLADGTRVAFGVTDTATVTVDHLVPRTSRSVVATVPRAAGTTGADPTRNDPWPAPRSAAASRTSP